MPAAAQVVCQVLLNQEVLVVVAAHPEVMVMAEMELRTQAAVEAVTMIQEVLT
jgi:hypothetical protein